MKKFLSTIYGKIVAILVVLGIGFAGYGIFMPTKEVEVPVDVEVEVEKLVYISGKDKIVEVEKIVEVIVVDNSEAVALRTELVDGFIDKLEGKIEIFEGKIEVIDDAIEVVQDDIDVKNNEITLLNSQINAKNLLIAALIVDDPVDNLADIRDLEDEIIALEVRIDNKQNAIDNFLEDIANLNETKEPWQDRIDLDTDCIAEINAYIATGADYSDDITERLEDLNLLI